MKVLIKSSYVFFNAIPKPNMRIDVPHKSIVTYKALITGDTTNPECAMLGRLLVSLGFRDIEHVIKWTCSKRKGGVFHDIKLMDFSYDEELVQMVQEKLPKSTAKVKPSEVMMTVRSFVYLLRKLCPAIMKKTKGCTRTLHGHRTERWFDINSNFLALFDRIVSI